MPTLFKVIFFKLILFKIWNNIVYILNNKRVQRQNLDMSMTILYSHGKMSHAEGMPYRVSNTVKHSPDSVVYSSVTCNSSFTNTRRCSVAHPIASIANSFMTKVKHKQTYLDSDGQSDAGDQKEQHDSFAD